MDVHRQSPRDPHGEQFFEVPCYLKQKRTASAKLLASRPVVIIHPAEHVGELVAKCPH
jgi:hypothetical protein